MLPLTDGYNLAAWSRFLIAQKALIFVCTALNSPEAGDAAVAIVRHRQNLRAEKVIARKNI